MGKENDASTANTSGSANKKRPFYRKRTNASDGNVSTPRAAVREMKFHMHDSAQQKTSESFRKIKETIILKIQKTFEDPIDIAESIRNNVKKVFEATTLTKITKSGDEKAMENMLYLEQFKIDFTIYRSESKRFDGAWVKAFALLWDTDCSKDVQRTIKEMPDYENVIRNDPVALLTIVESIMHTPEKVKYPILTLI